MYRRWILALALPLAAACSSPPAAPPHDPEAARLDADAEFLQRRDAAAEREYERLLATASAQDRGPILIQIGRCRLGKGDAAGAIAAFDEASTLPLSDAKKVETWYRRGLAHNSLWRPERALVDFRRVLDAPPDARASAIKADEFLLRLGVTYLRLGMNADGRRVLEQLVKEHPESTESAEARERLALKAIHVQIARTPNEITATRRAAEAKAKGLPAAVLTSASAPGGRLVVVGPYARFEDAIRELDRIRGLGYADAFPIP
jgi:tetratricopeptide (TPR) repeat protein